MKKIAIYTLFPQVIENYLNTSILKNAQNKNLVEFQIIDFRNFTANNYKQVDDYQYGGGAGMVLMVEPVVKALQTHASKNAHIILLSPRGPKLDQKKAMSLSQLNQEIIFLCGHYEGFDERINQFVHEYLSIGDYVLTSGEIAALVAIDATVRLIPGVINQESLIHESFNHDLLDHPVYTKPQNFLDLKVPEILLSGHHEKIATYRWAERIRLTKKYRPDLYKRYLKNKAKTKPIK